MSVTIREPAGAGARQIEFQAWGATLVPRLWKVVAGPPGHDEFETTLEDPARLARVLGTKEQS